MTDYPIHPACALWPRPSEDEIWALAEDIKARGLINPLWLFDGSILDGKVRYEACQIAGIEPRFETYTGDDPVNFTISQNKIRRHQELAALTLIVAGLCKLPSHRPKLTCLNRQVNQEARTDYLAKEAGVGRSNLVAAKAILKYAEPNILEMVRSEKVGIQSAATFVRNTSRDVQRKASVDQIKRSRDHQGRKAEPKITIAIPHEDVIGKFRPLIKRVKEQSKRHAATVSFVELSVIAHELEELADAWTENETEPGTHSAPVPIHRVRKGG